MDIMLWLSAILLLLGSLLGLAGGIGILRFPDFYTRMHAAGVTDTLCAGLFLGGLALQFGLFTLASAKLALIFMFLLFTAPTATHALAKSARGSGLKPWFKPGGTGEAESAPSETQGRELP